MVNKKSRNNESNFNDDDLEYDEKTDNLHLNLKNIDDENFKEEALSIYTAIKEGKIDLKPEEEQEILQELEFILNHVDSFKSNENHVDSNNNVDKSSLNVDIGEKYENEGADLVNDSYNNNSDEVISSQDSNNVVFDKDKFSFNEEGEDVSEDLSVDDALNELIDDVSLGTENNFSIDDSVEDIPVDNNDDNSSDVFFDVDSSEDLSVDDALNDLIDYSDEVAIKVENVSMEFKVSKDKIDTFKEYFIRTVKRNKSDSKIIKALDNVSFEILKGDRVGIIGFNGAGKSTLLKVLSGVYDATEGTIETKGNIAPLLELGAGFDSKYTGKDNIFLNGAFLGYSEDFLKEKYDEILEFSELGDAINYHVRTYSSGMRAKLAFSIATIVEPDILIIDEILSVGDIKFRKKSADKIRSLINSGITVLLVSHSVNQIRDLCNKAIWIDDGRLKMMGEVDEVCDAYVKAASDATKDQLENIKLN